MICPCPHDEHLYPGQHRAGLVASLDPRLKVFFVLATLLLNLWASHPLPVLLAGAVALGTLLAAKTGMKAVCRRLTPALIPGTVLVVVQTFLVGGKPLFAFSLFHWSLVGYAEGLAQGLFMLARIISGVLLVLALTFTTPLLGLLQALAWLRVPRILVEVALLACRYVFVLWEQAREIKEAQRARLGYARLVTSLRSAVMMTGMVVIRAYDRSERVYEALLSRGYRGENAATVTLPPWSRRELHQASIMALVLLLLVALTI